MGIGASSADADAQLKETVSASLNKSIGGSKPKRQRSKSVARQPMPTPSRRQGKASACDDGSTSSPGEGDAVTRVPADQAIKKSRLTLAGDAALVSPAKSKPESSSGSATPTPKPASKKGKGKQKGKKANAASMSDETESVSKAKDTIALFTKSRPGHVFNADDASGIASSLQAHTKALIRRGNNAFVGICHRLVKKLEVAIVAERERLKLEHNPLKPSSNFKSALQELLTVFRPDEVPYLFHNTEFILDMVGGFAER